VSTSRRLVRNSTPFYCSSTTVAEGAVLVQSTATDEYVTLPAGADITGPGVIGLAMSALTAAGMVDVAIVGDIFPAIANGSITRGDKLAIASSSGDVKTAAIGAGTNTFIVGTALESASTGERVACLINPYLMQG